MIFRSLNLVYEIVNSKLQWHFVIFQMQMQKVGKCVINVKYPLNIPRKKCQFIFWICIGHVIVFRPLGQVANNSSFNAVFLAIEKNIITLNKFNKNWWWLVMIIVHLSCYQIIILTSQNKVVAICQKTYVNGRYLFDNRRKLRPISTIL